MGVKIEIYKFLKNKKQAMFCAAKDKKDRAFVLVEGGTISDQRQQIRIENYLES